MKVMHFALSLWLLFATALSEAQPAAPIKRVGILAMGSPATAMTNFSAFREGLREQGFTEGENVIIEARYAEGKAERVPELAMELVRLPVDVILTAGTPLALAAKKATQNIPIVVAAAGSPTESGVVTPGGNVTALDVLPAELITKQLEVLKEMRPGLTRTAVIWNGSNPSAVITAKRVQAAAAAAAVQVIPIEVQSPAEMESPLSVVRDRGAQAVFIVADPQFFAQRKQIGDWLVATGLPALCQEREYGEAGCLVAYGANIRQMYRQSASYVARILRGNRVVDLPVGSPEQVDLLINARSATAMKLTIPPAMMSRATAVIQ